MEDNKDIVDYDKMSIDENIKFHKFIFQFVFIEDC